MVKDWAVESVAREVGPCFASRWPVYGAEEPSATVNLCVHLSKDALVQVSTVPYTQRVVMSAADMSGEFLDSQPLGTRVFHTHQAGHTQYEKSGEGWSCVVVIGNKPDYDVFERSVKQRLHVKSNDRRVARLCKQIWSNK